MDHRAKLSEALEELLMARVHLNCAFIALFGNDNQLPPSSDHWRIVLRDMDDQVSDLIKTLRGRMPQP